MVVDFDSSHVVFDLMPQILLGLWLQTIQTWRHADFAIILVFNYVVMQFGDSEMYITVSLLCRPGHTWASRRSRNIMTRNPKNFYVFVCWTWTEEIGMVQRFDGIIYWPFFYLPETLFWLCKSTVSKGLVFFLAQGNLLLPIIVRFARFLAIADMFRHGVCIFLIIYAVDCFKKGVR